MQRRLCACHYLVAVKLEKSTFVSCASRPCMMFYGSRPCIFASLSKDACKKDFFTGNGGVQMIKEKVFLGNREDYNKKLKYLAGLAQEEPWTFKNIEGKDPYRILRNYFHYTYDRLEEEGKIMVSPDGKYSCINTGLLTQYDQEIMAIFSRSEQPRFLPWYLIGFYRDTDRFFGSSLFDMGRRKEQMFFMFVQSFTNGQIMGFGC